MPPLQGSSGLANSQRTTSESPSFGCVENFASRLHSALSVTYSSRVLKLSTITTLPIGWSPQLSKRRVKATSSPGLAIAVEAILHSRSPAALHYHGVDRDAGRTYVAIAPLRHDLHGLGVGPGDGGVAPLGEEGHLGLVERAEADDRQVLVGLEGALEGPRTDDADPVARLVSRHKQRRIRPFLGLKPTCTGRRMAGASCQLSALSGQLSTISEQIVRGRPISRK